MEVLDEPLNLTIKKKPVAIVAPSSIIDTNQNVKTVNNNKHKWDVKLACDELPEDLSVRKTEDSSLRKSKDHPFKKTTQNEDSREEIHYKGSDTPNHEDPLSRRNYPGSNHFPSNSPADKDYSSNEEYQSSKEFCSKQDYQSSAIKRQSSKVFPSIFNKDSGKDYRDFDYPDKGSKEFATKAETIEKFTSDDFTNEEFTTKKFATKEFGTRKFATKEFPTKEFSLKKFATKELTTKECATKEFATEEFTTKEFATKEFPTRDFSTKDFISKDFTHKDYTTKECTTKGYANNKDYTHKDYSIKDYGSKDRPNGDDVSKDDASKHYKEAFPTNKDYPPSKQVNKLNELNYIQNNNEELRKYLFKNVEETRNSYNKNSFAENMKEHDLRSSIFKDVYKISDFYEKNIANLANPENIYTMINHLAEHKFLTAWYMNSVLTMPYVDQQKRTNSPTKNSILNNLLDKKPQVDFKNTANLDMLIRNEMHGDGFKGGDKNPQRSQVDQKNNVGDLKNNQDGSNGNDKKKPHIKKPLNAFMLYMKEMRAKVVAECTLKESAAINQILGRKWHSLSREEQAKYYEKARQERQLHMQLYPGWSARDNYGYGTKKKKRKKERTPVESGGNSMKKCRARYGLDQQSQWCKPCRRKKKCIRYMEAGDGNDGNQSDDNLGSCGSMGDAHTPPEDDGESLSQSMSSPGGLSALSSLTSPGGVVLPSPSTSVASPSVSVASPYMLQSPLTPHDAFDAKLPPPPHLHHQPPRNPVGTNPHDINNPLSVNQLTGQCVKNEPPDTGGNDNQRSIISVT